MKTFTTEEVNGLLDELTKVLVSREYQGKLMQNITEQFKKDKGLIEQLEVGKWFINPNNKDLLGYITHEESGNEDLDRLYFYGFNSNGEWTDKDYINVGGFSREATQDEVETALTKEAEKRGFKEGVKTHSLLNETHTLGDTPYRNKGFRFDGDLSYDGVTIMKEGKWATIINKPTEMTIAQIESKHGYTNLKIIAE